MYNIVTQAGGVSSEPLNASGSFSQRLCPRDSKDLLDHCVCFPTWAGKSHPYGEHMVWS